MSGLPVIGVKGVAALLFDVDPAGKGEKLSAPRCCWKMQCGGAAAVAVGVAEDGERGEATAETEAEATKRSGWGEAAIGVPSEKLWAPEIEAAYSLEGRTPFAPAEDEEDEGLGVVGVADAPAARSAALASRWRCFAPSAIRAPHSAVPCWSSGVSVSAAEQLLNAPIATPIVIVIGTPPNAEEGQPTARGEKRPAAPPAPPKIERDPSSGDDGERSEGEPTKSEPRLVARSMPRPSAGAATGVEAADEATEVDRRRAEGTHGEEEEVVVFLASAATASAECCCRPCAARCVTTTTDGAADEAEIVCTTEVHVGVAHVEARETVKTFPVAAPLDPLPSLAALVGGEGDGKAVEVAAGEAAVGEAGTAQATSATPRFRMRRGLVRRPPSPRRVFAASVTVGMPTSEDLGPACTAEEEAAEGEGVAGAQPYLAEGAAKVVG